MFMCDCTIVDAADAHSYASMANSSEESLIEQKQNGSSGNSGGSGGYTVATPSAAPSTGAHAVNAQANLLRSPPPITSPII